MGGECLVVGESQDVVSVTHVVGVHLVRVVRTFVDAFVHTGMGMQTCPFPAGGGSKICGGAVDFVSAERYRALEPVYRGDPECREPGDDSQEQRREGFQDDSGYSHASVFLTLYAKL